MDLEIATKIAAYIDAAPECEDCGGDEDYECETCGNDTSGALYKRYSGRGMFGEETAGIVFDNWGDFCTAIVLATRDHVAAGGDADEFVKAVENIRTDSMGLGKIVY